MRRRELLVAGAAIGIAGCSSKDVSEVPADSNASEGPENSTDEFDGEGPTESYEANDETHFLEAGETFEGYTDRGVEVRDIELLEPVPGGLQRVFATLENTRDEEIADIRLSVDFYNDETQLDSSWKMPTFLGSGETVRVRIIVGKDYTGQITRAGVKSAVRVDSLTPLNDGAVSVTDETFDQDADRPSVSGRVKNMEDMELERVYVHINFYDGNELIDWQRGGLERLAPGDAGEWTVQASQYIDADQIEDYKRRITLQQPE